MNWWYIILGGIHLFCFTPWLIVRLSDGLYLLNLIFRIVYWTTFFIAYEFTFVWGGNHWVFCLLLAHVPGALIWGYYEHRFGDDDEPEKIDSPKNPLNSESIIILNARDQGLANLQ